MRFFRSETISSLRNSRPLTVVLSVPVSILAFATFVVMSGSLLLSRSLSWFASLSQLLLS